VRVGERKNRGRGREGGRATGTAYGVQIFKTPVEKRGDAAAVMSLEEGEKRNVTERIR